MRTKDIYQAIGIPTISGLMAGLLFNGVINLITSIGLVDLPQKFVASHPNVTEGGILNAWAKAQKTTLGINVVTVSAFLVLGLTYGILFCVCECRNLPKRSGGPAVKPPATEATPLRLLAEIRDETTSIPRA